MKKTIKVNFHDLHKTDDSLMKFAVTYARSNGKNVFCKHRERDVWDLPGGRRERGEAISETAERELVEETGAIDFELEPVCAYSVVQVDDESGETVETFGLLCRAEIYSFEPELKSEMEKIVLMSGVPDDLRFPDIYPFLIERARRDIR